MSLRLQLPMDNIIFLCLVTMINNKSGLFAFIQFKICVKTLTLDGSSDKEANVGLSRVHIIIDTITHPQPQDIVFLDVLTALEVRHALWLFFSNLYHKHLSRLALGLEFV